MKSAVLLCLLLAIISPGGGQEATLPYCIIGGGPAGLQLGYFLQKAGREYVIFEKNSTVGSFFLHYPRHRTLISTNKRNTGSSNKEFSFRHDWNTLMSDDDSLQMRFYSKNYFPHADDYVRYLRDYASRLDLKLQLNTEIVDISRNGEEFLLRDQSGSSHSCQVLIVSTGVWVPNIPTDIPGIELAEGYESVSVNPEDFENKVVLILGRGNAGFETADNIVGSTAYIHMASRTRIKMAYQTHYVGDVRAINNNMVDTYQLKSLDGQFEISLGGDSAMYFQKGEDGRVYYRVRFFQGPLDYQAPDDALMKYGYDSVIRCLGFKFDFSIFNETVKPRPSPSSRKDQYPHMQPNYEAMGIPNMYFAGTVTHSLDYRRSAGGFIHGFRYTVRALFRHLEWRYQGIPWPSISLPATDLLNHMVKRINEASGPYQMFGELVDIALIKGDHTVQYLEEVPLQGLSMFNELTGHDIDRFIFWNFEYGENYSGPGNDVLREDRAIGDPIRADQSNFLHPVLYYYSTPPTTGSVWVSGALPKPDLYHHIVEDFLTDWTSRKEHIIPLRRFLEAALNADLRDFLAENCFELLFTYGDNLPLACKQHYLEGLGISSSDGNIDFGPAEAFLV